MTGDRPTFGSRYASCDIGRETAIFAAVAMNHECLIAHSGAFELPLRLVCRTFWVRFRTVTTI